MSTRDLCIIACTFCRDPQFLAWLDEMAGPEVAEQDPCTEAVAKHFILNACGVSSRNELDTDTVAAARFHELVRRPFLEWKEEQE